MIKCKFCNHSSNRHFDEGGCKSISCFCTAAKFIIEKVEGLANKTGVM